MITTTHVDTILALYTIQTINKTMIEKKVVSTDQTVQRNRNTANSTGIFKISDFAQIDGTFFAVLHWQQGDDYQMISMNKMNKLFSSAELQKYDINFHLHNKSLHHSNGCDSIVEKWPRKNYGSIEFYLEHFAQCTIAIRLALQSWNRK